MPWFIVLLITVAIDLVAYVIAPHPKNNTVVQDEQTPTASAGGPVPRIFGEVTVDDTNVLWFGDKSTHTYTVNS